MTIPSFDDVMASVTDEAFNLRNWAKHRDDPRHKTGPYPFHDAYAAFDGQRFTRRHVFEHFGQSPAKGVISAIKWGFPRGSGPGGKWHAFSDAIRTSGYVAVLEEVAALPSASPVTIVSRLNAVVSGIGTATTTKIAYFADLKARSASMPERGCLIYDQMVRRAIRKCEDPEFAELSAILRETPRDIWAAKQVATYGLYLEGAHLLAKRHKVTPAQIELMLFRVGRCLPAPR